MEKYANLIEVLERRVLNSFYLAKAISMPYSVFLYKLNDGGFTGDEMIRIANFICDSEKASNDFVDYLFCKRIIKD